MPVGRNEARDRRCELGERLEQDIGEHQAVRGAATKPRGAETIRMDELDSGPDTVDPRVVAGDGDRAGIDVACEHRPTQRSCRGDREHTGAGTDVEHAGVPFAPLAERGPIWFARTLAR